MHSYIHFVQPFIFVIDKVERWRVFDGFLYPFRRILPYYLPYFFNILKHLDTHDFITKNNVGEG